MTRDAVVRLDDIVDVQRDITDAGLDLDAVMQITMDRSQQLTGADGAMINLIDGDDMVVRAASGIAAPVMGDRRPFSTTLLRYAVASRRPVLVSDSRTDPRINPELQGKVQENSIICVPFFSGERAVGSLNIMKRSREHPLVEADRQTLELLGGILAASVCAAASYEAKRAELDALGRYQMIFDGAPIGIARFSLREGRAVEVNPTFAKLLGRTPQEILESPAFTFSHPEDRAAEQALLAELAAGEREEYELEKRYIGADGSEIWLQVRAAVEPEPGGEPANAIVMFQDITERRRADERFRQQAELTKHQARHDALTGLANRSLFRTDLEKALTDAVRTGSKVALMMLDLDRFKDINDSLGHHAGDAVLTNVAARLRGAVRSTETIARLGGDEFAILVPQVNRSTDVVPIADRVLTALQGPVAVEGVELTVDASIGICFYPDDAQGPDAMLQRADIAMYRAKSDQSGYAMYDAGFDTHDLGQLGLLGELHRAINKRELVVHYQPKIAIDSEQPMSVEALVRWQYPRRGLIPPMQFIPAAERSELIKPLTLYVLDEALRQCRVWDEQGMQLSIAVNVSTRNLMSIEFPDEVAQLLDKHHVPASRLTLEITESTVLGRQARGEHVLRRLEDLGVRLSVDDFGTGYCSLVHLRNLPISEIKVDRSFVSRMSDPRDFAVVRSIIDLARNLGLDVVAEGVEDEAARHQLRELGCDFAQGYYYCKPLPGSDLLAWMSGLDPVAEAAG